ncbi:MAG TPA: CheB methylesterase domain-containing protein, partial [Pseudobdellovibrionaceae bacterium]
KNGELRILLCDDAPLNRFKPSVDYLFNSIAELSICKNTHAAILTGMGEDGARGMLKMKKNGAYTIAQSEDSCVVFGMPKAAIEFNAINDILDIDAMTEALLGARPKCA